MFSSPKTISSLAKSLLITVGLIMPMGVMAAPDSVKTTWPMIRVGIDLSKASLPAWQDDYRAWVFQVDKQLKKELYGVIDAGFGKSTTNTPFVNYTSSNPFIAVGVDKTFFERLFVGDRDNASIGIRYGLAPVTRSAATYVITDPVWGNTVGNLPQQRFMAHWLELCGGFRMEITHRVFMGWTVRAKTLVNPNTVRELPPLYLVGFGRGEKNPAFDFNLYLMMGFGPREKQHSRSGTVTRY